MNVRTFSQIVFFATALLVSQELVAQEEQVDAAVDSGEQLSDGVERNTEIENFVSTLGNKFIHILVDQSKPLKARKDAFRKILDRDFDMNSIGQFVIARYWRSMTEAQQKEYLKLFVNAVVENYASQFDNYDNEKLVVNHSRTTEEGGYLVNSSIIRPGKGQPLKVEWKIFKTPRGMKVTDIIVDGVSMSITLRSEYSSAFASRGGVDGLLDYLREKSSERPKASSTKDD